jgi:hypothetical protein
MAARRSRPQAGAIFLSLLGCALLVLGGWHLLRLERTYLPDEVLYRGSPDTLLLWLASLDVEDAETAERLRERLLSMPLAGATRCGACPGRKRHLDTVCG